MSPTDLFNDAYFDMLSRFFNIFKWIVPFILLVVGWKLWIRHVNAEWISNLKWTLLEIKIPRDIYKTPASGDYRSRRLRHESLGFDARRRMEFMGL